MVVFPSADPIRGRHRVGGSGTIMTRPITIRSQAHRCRPVAAGDLHFGSSVMSANGVACAVPRRLTHYRTRAGALVSWRLMPEK